MNILSRTITGLAMVIIGAVLVVVSFFTSAFIVTLIYGIPLLILGLFLLFNTKEDKIEKIKSRGGKKHG